MLRGEAIAWLHALIMYEGILMFEEDIESKSKEDILKGTTVPS